MNRKPYAHALIGALGLFGIGAVLPVACASPEDPSFPIDEGIIEEKDAGKDVKVTEAGYDAEGGNGGTAGEGGSAGDAGSGGTAGSAGSAGYGGSGGGGVGGSGGGSTGGSGGYMAYSGSQLEPSAQCDSDQIYIFGTCFPPK